MFGRIFGRRTTGLTKRQFTDLYVDGLRRRIPGTTFIVPYELAVLWRKPGENQITQDLTFFWEAIQERSIDFQKTVIAGLIDQAAIHSKTPADAFGARHRAGDPDYRFDIEHVLPVIRHRDRPMTADALRQGMPHRAFAGDLVVHCVFDHVRNMSAICNDDLITLGIDEDALWARALDNLGRRDLMQEDDYEPSLMLDGRFWAKVERDYGGEHLAMIPCTNTLIFARPDSGHLAVALQHAHDIFLEAENAISTEVFCRRNGVWQVGRVPEQLKPRRVAT